jgi:hypothetical protein
MKYIFRKRTIFCVFYTHPNHMIKNGGHGFKTLHAIFHSRQKANEYIADRIKHMDNMFDVDEIEYKNDLMTLSFEIVKRELL